MLTSRVAPLAEDSSLGPTDAASSSMLPSDAELRSQWSRLPWLLAEESWVDPSAPLWLSKISSTPLTSSSTREVKYGYSKLCFKYCFSL